MKRGLIAYPVVPARTVMLKKTALITSLALVLYLGTALPVSAQSAEAQQWSIGGGYWTLPNIDTQDGAIDSSGAYAAAAIRSSDYMMEVDYSFQDPTFFALVGDYLYPLSEAGSFVGGSGYIGAGYTYFSCDDLENKSGFNVVVCADFGQSLFGAIRYDFLGGDQELFTIGITYSFQ